MKNILVNFDLESKKVIQELVNEDKKFNQLIERLQTAKSAIEYDNKLSVLTHKIKK
jgi:hypothetical protein